MKKKTICRLRDVERLLKQSAQQSQPSSEVKNRIKAELMVRIETTPRLSFSQWFFSEFTLFRKMLAGTVAVCLVLFATSIHSSSIPETEASGMYVRIIYGGAALSFGDTLRKAADQDALTVGDTLITGKDSFVEIEVFGHSMVRLGDLSTVTIADVSTDQHVTLDVDGKVWVKTVGGDNNLRIRTADGVNVSVPNGAVSIESNKRFTRIITKENIALVEIKNTRRDEIKAHNIKVIKDHLVYIPSPRMAVKAMKQEIVTKPTTTSSKWITENETQDKEYATTLETKKQDAIAKEAGVLPDSPLYIAKKITEKATLTIAGDEGKSLIQLENAEKRLLEAVALFEQGKTDEASKMLTDYKAAIGLIQEDIARIYGSKSDEIQMALKAHLTSIKDKLALAVTPDKPSYEALKFVEDKILTLSDEKSQAQEKDSLALKKLYEMLDLLSKGDTVSGQTHFTEYEDMTRESIDMAMKLLRQGDPTAAKAVLSQKNDIELPLLDVASQNPELAERVEALKKYTTENLATISQELSKLSEPTAVIKGAAVKQADTPAVLEEPTI